MFLFAANKVYSKIVCIPEKRLRLKGLKIHSMEHKVTSNLVAKKESKDFIYRTQVEFPEARIYEETLNILLYEHRNGPDQELMQATSSRGAVSGAPPCTSDEEEGERSGLARLRSNKQNTN